MIYICEGLNQNSACSLSNDSVRAHSVVKRFFLEMGQFSLFFTLCFIVGVLSNKWVLSEEEEEEEKADWVVPNDLIERVNRSGRCAFPADNLEALICKNYPFRTSNRLSTLVWISNRVPELSILKQRIPLLKVFLKIMHFYF